MTYNTYYNAIMKHIKIGDLMQTKYRDDNRRIEDLSNIQKQLSFFPYSIQNAARIGEKKMLFSNKVMGWKFVLERFILLVKYNQREQKISNEVFDLILKESNIEKEELSISEISYIFGIPRNVLDSEKSKNLILLLNNKFPPSEVATTRESHGVRYSNTNKVRYINLIVMILKICENMVFSTTNSFLNKEDWCIFQ